MDFISRCLEVLFSQVKPLRSTPEPQGFSRGASASFAASHCCLTGLHQRGSASLCPEHIQQANTLSKKISYRPTLQKIKCLFLKSAPNLDSNTLNCCAALFSIECLDLWNMGLIKSGQPTNCREFSYNWLAKKELQQLLAAIETSVLCPDKLPVSPIYAWELGCSRLTAWKLPQHRSNPAALHVND